jgi:hypothetical protein
MDGRGERRIGGPETVFTVNTWGDTLVCKAGFVAGA